jgi:hypothetical protein
MSALLEYLGRDGVDVSSLRSLYERLGAREEFVRDVIGALGQLDTQEAWRAVWLLKRSAADSKLGRDDLRKIAELVDSSEHWVFRLTMCQLFAETGCFREFREQVFSFLQRNFDDRRAIIRAWALSAMADFEGDPLYRRSIQQMRRAAEQDHSKAMQARLRRLKKPNRALQPAATRVKSRTTPM